MSGAAATTVEAPAAHLVVAGTGTAILCLHGWGASTDLFTPLVRTLEARWSLYVPDLPGFGETPPPLEPWGVGEYVSWVLRLLDHHGLDRVDIVAHSFGGRIALKLAAQHPDRVRHMVLTGAAGIRDRPGIVTRVRIRGFKTIRWASTAVLLPGVLREPLRRRVAQSGSRDYRAAQGMMRPTFVRVLNEDLRGLMPEIKAPTLLVWGDLDDEAPLEYGRIMERLIPDSGLVILEGGSHYAYIEQAARFGLIVETFLATTA